MSENDIRRGYETGFIDSSLAVDDNYLPKLLINSQPNSKLRKDEKILDTIISELEKCSEFIFSVAFITNGGVDCLIDTLEKLGKRNVKGKILASQYQNFTQPRALRRLLKLKNIELKIVTEENFHAKGYVFKKVIDGNIEYSIIVGSSNLTDTALGRNNEWNVKLLSTKNGSLYKEVYDEFCEVFNRATTVNERWLKEYEKVYVKYDKAWQELKDDDNAILPFKPIYPNKMQVDALNCLENLRSKGENKGILISATGTGKTYLSAFDVNRLKPKKFLFIVHRDVILKDAMESYKKVMGPSVEMDTFTGNNKGCAPYLFASIQTLSKEQNLHKFKPDEFDYIVVDEVHRSGAESYQKVLGYFKPKFLLGMTATPERTDGADIFEMFDHNIAYEIRLKKALEENMLAPFHYHGISDVMVNDESLNDNSDFRYLVTDERVKHIMNMSKKYGCDRGRIKGLVFCSRVEEAEKLSDKIKKDYGYRTEVLCGENSTKDRQTAIEQLQADEGEQLDYVFTVDIFNEGVDIPRVNQIILLRPTQSVIVFVQQLGRGLRKAKGKDYLEVLDFIGNYENNYMIPIALYGDRTKNKDNIRKALVTNFIPGASTVEFDDIVKEKIFATINKARINSLAELKADYKIIKDQLGRVPMMMDFIRLGSRDPITFLDFKKASSRKSYYEFVRKMENIIPAMSRKMLEQLEYINQHVADGKRIEEIILLQILINKGKCSFEYIEKEISTKFGIKTSPEIMASVVNYINGDFFKNKYAGVNFVKEERNIYYAEDEFANALKDEEYKNFLSDSLEYAYETFKARFSESPYRSGFILHQKYTRRDVCRILCWDQDESSTMYGYRIKYNTCPIFVTYKKGEDISESTKYNDRFVNEKQFSWMTRNKVTLESTEVKEIQKKNTRISLFIKQSDSEGGDFYYMGDAKINESKDAIKELKINDKKGKKLPIVNILFDLMDATDEKFIKYFDTDFSSTSR